MKNVEPSKLTNEEIQKGRRYFLVSTILKDVTTKLLGPSILTLYVLHLGAGNIYIGFLNSLIYLPFAFIFLGKMAVSRMGAVRVRGVFSLLRYSFLLPILMTALPAFREPAALPLAIIGASLFVSRSAFQLASSSLKPIQGELAGDRDPGAFLFRLQLIRSVLTTAAGVAIAFILDMGSPVTMYLMFITCGILIGLIAGCLVFQIPEPRQAERGFQRALWRTIREGLKYRGFRRFLSLQFLRKLGTSMIAPFLIVYFKNIYLYPDSMIVLFTVVGGLGSISVSLLAGRYLDRIGAKPVLVTTTIFFLPIFTPLVLAPSAVPGLRWFIPILVFFLFFFGRTGLMVSERAYFFASIVPEGRLNLGIASTLAIEVAAAAGSLLGGVILDSLTRNLSGGEEAAFRIYFSGLAAMFIALSLLMIRLPRKFTFNPNIGRH